MEQHQHHYHSCCFSFFPQAAAAVHRASVAAFLLLLLLLPLAFFNLWRFSSVVPHVQQQLAMAEYFIPSEPPSPNHHHNLYLSPSASSSFSSLLSELPRCNFFEGTWIHEPTPPLYNETCKYIYENQNCMKNGRLDKDFIYWKWKPNDCDLPTFDPRLFLQLMANKKLVFIGDSLARNHMESLLCSLAQVEAPMELKGFGEYAWRSPSYNYTFKSYNFTLSRAWSPFLANYTMEGSSARIHLDRMDDIWASALPSYDVAIFSSTYWFYRPNVYYFQNKEISMEEPKTINGMKMVWNHTFKYLLDNYNGTVILRTVSVSHFDENHWDTGGKCNKTKPYFVSDMSLEWQHNEAYKAQIEAFDNAVALASKGTGSQPMLRLLDVTRSTFLRPDGHPNSYRIQTSDERRNDCVHWCMPGPVDMWNQLLLVIFLIMDLT